jgi:ATP-dependent Clp protease ATP-binding subunit ClpA
MLVSMFERFTDRGRRVLVLAQEEARLLNHNVIGAEHILLGLMRDGEGVAAEALGSLGLSLEGVREKVGVVRAAAPSPTGWPPFTRRARKVLTLALRDALQHGDNDIGAEHLLVGWLREGEGAAAQVQASLGAHPDDNPRPSDLVSRVRQQVIESLSGDQQDRTIIERFELQGREASWPHELTAAETDEIAAAIRSQIETHRPTEEPYRRYGSDISEVERSPGRFGRLVRRRAVVRR